MGPHNLVCVNMHNLGPMLGSFISHCVSVEGFCDNGVRVKGVRLYYHLASF